MENINFAVLSGNLVADADKIPNTEMVRFTIASSTSRKQGDEWVDYPNYIDCTLYGKRAEAVAQFLVKGQRVTVTGRIAQDRWEGKDGERRSKVYLRVSDLELPPHQREQHKDDSPWR